MSARRNYEHVIKKLQGTLCRHPGARGSSVPCLVPTAKGDGWKLWNCGKAYAFGSPNLVGFVHAIAFRFHERREPLARR